MEVAPFFVDFHHFLSIFTIFYRFSRFTHFCRDLHFVAIYALFPQIFLAKITISATSHVFCMYDVILYHIFSDKKFGFRVFPAESNGLGDALKGIRDTLRYLKLG